MVLLIALTVLYFCLAFIGFFKAGNQSAAWASGKQAPLRPMWVQVLVLLFYMLCMISALLMLWYQQMDGSFAIVMSGLLWFLNKKFFKDSLIRKMK